MVLLLLIVLFISQCISLEPPPITFTQTQTAAEKQMIGTDKQLEKNGWLISSIQSSSSGTTNWKKESTEELGFGEENKEYLMILRALAYLTPEVKTYKDIGILGENLKGELSMNPLFEQEKYPKYNSGEKKKRIQDVIKLTNSYREKIYQKKLEIQKKKTTLVPLKLNKMKKELKLTYYREVQPGEYYESEEGTWIRKE